MRVISEGFSVKYEVLKVATIKPGASGEFNGNAYKASVKFRSSLVIERENEKVGIQETESIVEFKIPCQSNEEASQVSELVRKARSNNDPIYVNSGLPVKNQNSEVLVVTSLDSAEVFMKQFNAHSQKAVKQNS